MELGLDAMKLAPRCISLATANTLLPDCPGNVMAVVVEAQTQDFSKPRPRRFYILLLVALLLRVHYGGVDVSMHHLGAANSMRHIWTTQPIQVEQFEL